MNDVMVASSQADSRAGEAMVEHHATMAAVLGGYADQLAAAVRDGRDDADEIRRDLATWCRTDLVSHALAEEAALYPAAAARPEAALLITAMLGEHQAILGLVDRIEHAGDPVTAVTAAAALRAMFDSHLGKENELVLPLLLTAPGVSVAALLDGMHEALGGHEAEQHAEPAEPAEQAGHGHGGHACGCGEKDPDGFPELDARVVPHAIRHATVFGALDAVRPGGGLVLVAPHDPLPLLAQIEGREPGTFTMEYLQRGPEAWRIAIVRRAS